MKKKRIKILELKQSKKEIDNVLVKGWIRTKRSSKNFSFIEINDGSCLKNLQIVVDNSLGTYEAIKKLVITGASIEVLGSLIESNGLQKWELKADNITIIGFSDDSYPLQKKRHSDEFLRTISHLRPRTNKYGAMFRIRSDLSWAIHNFFKDRGFKYIHTPVITASDCEGAGDMFKLTTKTYDDFFGSKVGLTVSGQLSAEMFALSLGDVYTFGPTFRAENSNTSRHAAEFWMLEPEMSFCNLVDSIGVAEELIKYLIYFVMSECKEDFELFSNFVDKNLKETLENIVSSDFIRLEYIEAIEILIKVNKKFQFDIKYGSDLKSEHEKYLTEKYFKKPVVISNYPKEIKPFYMRLNEDNKTVAAMDVLLPRVGEIIGGSQREERYDFLIKRMKEKSLNEKKYWWYLDSRRYGSVKHSGFGMGFERLLMMITGVNNIRDVIPFSRTPGNIDF